jgi:hypothetical protein
VVAEEPHVQEICALPTEYAIEAARFTGSASVLIAALPMGAPSAENTAKKQRTRPSVAFCYHNNARHRPLNRNGSDHSEQITVVSAKCLLKNADVPGHVLSELL